MKRQEIDQALASERVEERRSVVRFLEGRESFGSFELDVLFKVLADDDWRVRRDALDVALAMTDESCVDRVIAGILQNERVGLRNACIELARAMGAGYARGIRSVAEPLSPLLFDGIGGGVVELDFVEQHARAADVNIAAAAIAALSRIGGEPAERALVELVQSKEHFRCISALDALRQLDASLSFDLLAPALDDRILWRSAVPFLGGTGDSRALPPLLRALTSTGEVARLAAIGLVRLGETQDTARIAAELEDAHRWSLRSIVGPDDAGLAAMLLLTYARDESVFPHLLASLADGTLPPTVVSALRDWGHQAARISVRLDTPHRAVAMELAAELALGDEDVERAVAKELTEAIDHHDPALVIAGLRGLAHVGSGELAESMVRVALSSPPAIAEQAALALASIAQRHPAEVKDVLQAVRLEEGTSALAPLMADLLGPEAKEVLIAGLSMGDPDLRAACAKALGGLGQSDVVGDLAFALGDEQAEVRLAATEALGRLRSASGEAVGLSTLQQAAMAGEDVSLRAAACEALATIGDPASLDLLLSIVEQATEGVAAAALNAAYRMAAERVDIDALLAAPDSQLVLAAAELLDDSDARWRTLLRHPSRDVRRRAVIAVAQSKESAAYLESRIEEETDSAVLEALRVALAGLSS